MKYSGFICEHTAEFVLVPKLISILRERFKYVSPLFPWLSRECGNLAKEIHKEDIFRVIGLQPKRPKMILNGEYAVIKVNSEFITDALNASKAKIPMILGCPLAKSIWDVTPETECIWINLLQSTPQDYIIQYNSDDRLETIAGNQEFVNERQILDIVDTNSHEINYNDLVTAIRAIRGKGSPRSQFMGYGSYRPVYFLMK